MGERAVAVVDANVLLNLATPVVDSRDEAPTGADPLKAFLASYEVHTPSSVLGEISEAAGGGDLLAAAADLVLLAAEHLTTHDVVNRSAEPLEYGLDRGETEGIWLANELAADLFVTDEFGAPNYLLVSLALDDRNTLFTTPHVLCALADADVLPPEYVDAALGYYVETKGWDGGYVAQLRRTYDLS
jgi:hypothetical protein